MKRASKKRPRGKTPSKKGTPSSLKTRQGGASRRKPIMRHSKEG